jgi:hypothetical protein
LRIELDLEFVGEILLGEGFVFAKPPAMTIMPSFSNPANAERASA